MVFLSVMDVSNNSITDAAFPACRFQTTPSQLTPQFQITSPGYLSHGFMLPPAINLKPDFRLTSIFSTFSRAYKTHTFQNPLPSESVRKKMMIFPMGRLSISNARIFKKARHCSSYAPPWNCKVSCFFKNVFQISCKAYYTSRKRSCTVLSRNFFSWAHKNIP